MMEDLFTMVGRATAGFFDEVRSLRVATPVAPEEIRRHLASHYDFSRPVAEAELVSDVSDLLRRFSLHVTHPRYFGLFNPSVVPVTVAADALVALYNPQLAVWAHSPAANEMERHVLRFFLRRIGFDPDSAFANFTTGGQEANATAVIAALTRAFPAFDEDGLRALDRQPTLYLSAEGHHSFQKIAHATGLGRRAVRTVPVDSTLRVDVAALRSAINRDRSEGQQPFLAVATAGTTAAGVIDPLPQVADFCREAGLWLHVDAAWGGTGLLSRRLRPHLEGIERADSVTWDAHKWLSVPVGAGMFFTRHADVVARAFRVAAESYVPPAVAGCHDSYETTLQWSRRFIGLKVFMALAALGAGGYEELVDQQTAMGSLLRKELQRAGWQIVNQTPLPLVCFTHERIVSSSPTCRAVVDEVNGRGRAWISEVLLSGGTKALRACITSYRTSPQDIGILIEELQRSLGPL